MGAGITQKKARAWLVRYCEKRCKQFTKDEPDTWRGHSWEVTSEPGAWCPTARIELRNATRLRMFKARVIRASNGEAAIVSELEYDAPNPYTEEAACRASH
jgi:hypothetical protein